MVIDVAKVQFSDAVQEFDQPLISARDRCTQLVAVHIEIIKQTNKAFLGLVSTRGILDVPEHLFQRFIQVLILRGPGTDIAEQFRRQHEESLFLNKAVTSLLRLFIREFGIVEVRVARFDFDRIDVVGQVF